MPFQIIVGEKGLKNQQLEIKHRATGERNMVPMEEIVPIIKNLLSQKGSQS
jgi:histidyl-tRNA synthetase